MLTHSLLVHLRVCNDLSVSLFETHAEGKYKGRIVISHAQGGEFVRQEMKGLHIPHLF
jgi:hypothetical protein